MSQSSRWFKFETTSLADISKCVAKVNPVSSAWYIKDGVAYGYLYFAYAKRPPIKRLWFYPGRVSFCSSGYAGLLVENNEIAGMYGQSYYDMMTAPLLEPVPVVTVKTKYHSYIEEKSVLTAGQEERRLKLLANIRKPKKSHKKKKDTPRPTFRTQDGGALYYCLSNDDDLPVRPEVILKSSYSSSEENGISEAHSASE